MTSVGMRLGQTTMTVVILASLTGKALGEPPAGRDALVIRLVHPERQAADVLRLFDGARAPHPAAALAAWKRATHDPAQLGKPLEAVIALFNPDMVPEWRVMHAAELSVDLGASDGARHWFAVVPHDDGTISAAITAKRLTDGGEEALLVREGVETPVERIGPPGSIVASRIGETLVFAGSRADLIRGVSRLQAARPAETANTLGQTVHGATYVAWPAGLGEQLVCGLAFEIDPAHLGAAGSPLAVRRAGVLLRGLACRLIRGSLALQGECLALEVTTFTNEDSRAVPILTRSSACVKPAWLEWVPSEGVMAMISLAFEPGAAFGDWAFALADRLERADPARAELAPLRARVNLLAGAAGVRPEVDLWPHVTGLTACVLGETDRPGRPTGALVVIHVDAEASAARLASEVLPRLGARFAGTETIAATGRGPAARPDRAATRTPPARPGDPAPGPLPPPADNPAIAEPRRVATVSGRAVTVWRRGRDVLVAWGDDALAAARTAVTNPARSVAPLCAAWAHAGKPAPQRVGAFWPARTWSPTRDRAGATPAWRTLADGPPAVWWGWNGPDKATDSIQYSGLRHRIHHFLEQLPLDPPALH
jgi:hypothetical protein